MIINEHKRDTRVDPEFVISASTIEEARLCEARFARDYWSQIRRILKHVDFPGRQPRLRDPANLLLDIGYHHVTNKVKSILERHDMDYSLGLFHRAGSSQAAPLAYDLVELFRADTVDAELLRFFRLKKKYVQEVKNEEIAIFLNRLNNRISKSYYLQDFHACRSYAYYMELQILHFSKAVSEKKVFQPLYLPKRHEDRC